MGSTAIVVPQIKVDEAQLADLQMKSPTLLKQAEEFTIENEDDYVGSLALVNIAIDGENTIDKFFEEPKTLAFQLHRSITSRVAFLKNPYGKVRDIISGKRRDYRAKVEKADREREALQREIAKKAADEQALADAQALAAQGEHEAADQILEQAAKAPPPAVVVQSSITKQAGTTLRKPWTFRIDDPDKVPVEYKIIDESKIRKVVQALGEKHGIPGVTAYQADQESFRRK